MSFKSINPNLERDFLWHKIMEYQGVYDTVGKEVEVRHVLNAIKNGVHKTAIEKIRNTFDKNDRNKEKLNLPAHTFGGTFSPFRKRHLLEESTGLAIMDFDNVEDVLSTKKALIDKNALAVWLSPSGNGLKALVRIPVVNNDETYKRHYNKLLQFYSQEQGDVSTSDISRLCFVSYDPELKVNFKAEVFVEKEPLIEPKKRILKFPDQPKPNSNVTAEILEKWWIKKGFYRQGNRSNSIYYLAKILNEHGIEIKGIREVCLKYREDSFKVSEIEKCISSAIKSTEFNSKSINPWKV